MGELATNGRDVYPDPTIPGEGGPRPAAGLIVPQDRRLSINGAPVTEDSHILVVSNAGRTGTSE